jgi:F0F1-type ATP synthase assembly protein I
VTNFSNSESDTKSTGGLQRYVPALKLLGIGWYFATAVVLGIVGGYLLDQLLDTRPIFTLIGVFVALASAFYGTYRMLLPIIRAAGPPPGSKGGHRDVA